LTKPEVGHFRAQGVPLKRKLREFPITEDALLPLGASIGVRHFVPGQYVDVTGITKGKGFQVNCQLTVSLHAIFGNSDVCVKHNIGLGID